MSSPCIFILDFHGQAYKLCQNAIIFSHIQLLLSTAFCDFVSTSCFHWQISKGKYTLMLSFHYTRTEMTIFSLLSCIHLCGSG